MMTEKGYIQTDLELTAVLPVLRQMQESRTVSGELADLLKSTEQAVRDVRDSLRRSYGIHEEYCLASCPGLQGIDRKCGSVLTAMGLVMKRMAGNVRDPEVSDVLGAVSIILGRVGDRFFGA